MKARANTTITVLRGTETNIYGDEVDSTDAGSIHLVRIPAALVETSRTSRNPVDGERRTIRTVTCRVGSEVDVQQDDRVKDERTGVVYQVTTIHRVASPVNTSDVTLELEYTTG